MCRAALRGLPCRVLRADPGVRPARSMAQHGCFAARRNEALKGFVPCGIARIALSCPVGRPRVGPGRSMAQHSCFAERVVPCRTVSRSSFFFLFFSKFYVH